MKASLKYQKIIPCLIMAFSMIVCSCAESQEHVQKYLVDFHSKDVGNVRFYMDLRFTDGKIKGGSIKGGYREVFPFWDRKKIGLFAGLKDGRLISIEGQVDSSLPGHFISVLSSPLGSYNFIGNVSNDSISGNLTDSKGMITGMISGKLSQNGTIKPLSNYYQISQDVLDSISKTFFNPAFLSSKDYQSFDKTLLEYSSKAIDDLHYVFSVYYYMRSFPYSHFGIWRKDTVEWDKEALPNVEYRLEKKIGIFTIRTFSGDSGAISQIFEQIAKTNPDKLIIDLRDNPGGNFNPAMELGKFLISDTINAGYFLRRKYFSSQPHSLKESHVFTGGSLDEFYRAIAENTSVNLVFTPDPNKYMFKKEVYILVNEGTASTCEPFIYALKGRKGITIVGENTAGKMLSATEIGLLDGFELFVPTADYVTAKGEHLDQKGVTPDMILSSKKDGLVQLLDTLGR